MNNAGRIGFLIKGEYDNTVTYDFLDVVYYNGASYVAKKPTIGNAPARNNEYWQIFAEGGTLTENSDISDTTVAFTEAESRVNVASGEKMSVLFAKVKKWLSDLKPHAFFVPVNDLTSTDSSLALAATQGKALSDMLGDVGDGLLFQNIERNGYKDNLLQVSLQIKNHDSNKTRLVYNPSQNCPVSSAPVLGLWECYWYNETHVLVRFIEFYPMNGRIWTNLYNTHKWSGWSSLTPQNATILYDGTVIRYTEGGTTKLKKSIAGFPYLRITYYVASNTTANPKTTYLTVTIPVYSPATARTMLVGTQSNYTSYFGIDIIGDTLYSQYGNRVSLSGVPDSYNNQLYITKIEGLNI